MALTLEAQRNEAIAQVGVLVGAAAGSKHLESLYWSLNPLAKQVAQMEARRQIDPTTAALVLETKYPQQLLGLVSLETLTLAAAKRAILPAGHIKVLGGTSAWACNCRVEQSGLWCGLVVFLGAAEVAELTDWDTGRVYRVVVPSGAVGGTSVVLEWVK